VFILILLLAILAGCAPLPASEPAVGVTVTSLLAQTPSPTPTLLPSATLLPTANAAPTRVPSPTAVPTDLYNRYIGKDATRQPALVQTPPAALISARSADGYARSTVAIFLDGKQVNGEEIRGDPVMLAALIRLFGDAYKAGHTSETVLSSYRSFAEQAYLEETNAEENGNAVAPAGRSEHQLGTAVDLAWSAVRLNFYLMNIDPRARDFYNWLKDNSFRYGFIFSYPFKSNADQSKTNILEAYITEYKAEPWHLRYVGPDLAARITAARDAQGRGYLDPLSPLIPQQFLLP
jgi:zinc D-Ala-D-Ala carboxypeptidase